MFKVQIVKSPPEIIYVERPLKNRQNKGLNNKR